MWLVAIVLDNAALEGAVNPQKLKDTELENEIKAKCYFEVVDAVSEF